MNKSAASVVCFMGRTAYSLEDLLGDIYLYTHTVAALDCVARRTIDSEAVVSRWIPLNKEWRSGFRVYLEHQRSLASVRGPAATAMWLHALASRSLALLGAKKMPPGLDGLSSIVEALQHDVAERSAELATLNEQWEHARVAKAEIEELGAVDSELANIEPWQSLRDARVADRLPEMEPRGLSRLARSWAAGWLTLDDETFIRELVQTRPDAAFTRAYRTHLVEVLGNISIQRNNLAPEGELLFRQFLPHYGRGEILAIRNGINGTVWTWPGGEVRVPWGERETSLDLAGSVGVVRATVYEIAVEDD